MGDGNRLSAPIYRAQGSFRFKKTMVERQDMSFGDEHHSNFLHFQLMT